MNLTRDDVLDILRHDLPRLVEEYPDLRYALIGTLSDVFVRKEELRDVLDEIKALRTDFNRGLEEHSQQLKASRTDFNNEIKASRTDFNNEIKALRTDFNRGFQEHSQRLEEHSQRLEEHSQRLEEHSRRIEELSRQIEGLRVDFNRGFQEHNARLEEHSQRIETLVESVKTLNANLKSSIGALGARWGIMSEQAFREGLRGILKTTGWKVERFWEIDTEGIVFGRPEQVELDVAISDGEITLIEIKSSIDIDNIYTFLRKAVFYEKFKGVTVTRRAVISPFVEDYAGERARELGLEVYTSGVEFRPIQVLE